MADTTGRGIVYSTRNGILVGRDGLPWRTVENEPWYADDPLVRANPHDFSRVPVRVASTELSAAPAPVEQASHAPGEVRRGR